MVRLCVRVGQKQRQKDRQTDRQADIDIQIDSHRQTKTERLFYLVEADSHDTFGQVSLEMNLSRRPASGGVDGTIRGN